MRLVEYRQSDGSWTSDYTARRFSSKAEVAALVQAAGTAIPLPYYYGTVKHESGYCWNERDTEDSGFQSWGLFQIGQAEADDAGYGSYDLLSPEVNAKVMAYLAERNRASLRELLGLSPDQLDPRDMGAYLSIAHNQGLGAARKTVSEYGMDWEAYKARNGSTVKPGFNGPAIVRYGEDCLYDPVTGRALVASVGVGAGLAIAAAAVVGLGIVIATR